MLACAALWYAAIVQDAAAPPARILSLKRRLGQEGLTSKMDIVQVLRAGAGTTSTPPAQTPFLAPRPRSLACKLMTPTPIMTRVVDAGHAELTLTPLARSGGSADAGNFSALCAGLLGHPAPSAETDLMIKQRRPRQPPPSTSRWTTLGPHRGRDMTTALSLTMQAAEGRPSGLRDQSHRRSCPATPMPCVSAARPNGTLT